MSKPYLTGIFVVLWLVFGFMGLIYLAINNPIQPCPEGKVLVMQATGREVCVQK